ncbi:2'-5' RNA ligase family protein [Spirillospora sp. NPDC050679]
MLRPQRLQRPPPPYRLGPRVTTRSSRGWCVRPPETSVAVALCPGTAPPRPTFRDLDPVRLRPPRGLDPVRAAIREAVDKTVTVHRLSDEPEWTPHVSVAYSPCDRPAAPVLDALAEPPPPQPFTVRAVHPVKQERAGAAVSLGTTRRRPTGRLASRVRSSTGRTGAPTLKPRKAGRQSRFRGRAPEAAPGVSAYFFRGLLLSPCPRPP